MKSSGDSRLLSESNSTLNGCDLIPPTQTSEQEYSYLMASSRWLSAFTPEALTKTYPEGPGRILVEVDKTYVNVFGISLRFLEILLVRKIWSVVLRPGRKLHWVSSSFGSIITLDLFKALGIRLSREAKERQTLY